MKKSNNKNRYILLFIFFFFSLATMFTHSMVFIIMVALTGIIIVIHKYYSKPLDKTFSADKETSPEKPNKDISFFDDFSYDD